MLSEKKYCWYCIGIGNTAIDFIWYRIGKEISNNVLPDEKTRSGFGKHQRYLKLKINVLKSENIT